MDYKKDNSQRSVMSHRPASGLEAFSIALPKKCERLSTAIYLVTNFLSDIEPMKPRLRTLSLDFVRDATLLKNGGYGVEANVLESLRSNIIETLTLLELAFVSGLISEMNFTLLKREYSALRDTIEVKKASRESRTDSVLGDTFFGSAFNREENISSPVLHPRSELTGSLEERFPKSAFAPKSSPTMSFRMSDRKNVEALKSDLAGTPEGRTLVGPHRAITNVQKEGRRARILKLIKDNREVTIKDITNHFPELSEKTIQREISTLVEANVLKKFGERRWSRYAIV